GGCGIAGDLDLLAGHTRVLGGSLLGLALREGLRGEEPCSDQDQECGKEPLRSPHATSSHLGMGWRDRSQRDAPETCRMIRCRTSKPHAAPGHTITDDDAEDGV